MRKQITHNAVVQVISSQQGPPGPPGHSAETLTVRLDDQGSVLYKGEATQIGALESDPVWRIKRIELNPDGSVSVLWPATGAGFDQIWDLRATLVYQ